MQAKKILVLATGEFKAQAVYELINGDITSLIPGSILKTHPDVTLITDKAAASKL